ncbi:hypothetical protein JTE90_015687 [Oedothorax gibbosus]|uniref:EF-hand domain-containing protein n=1 Tax=Oedothorax gibbosus TaxID=931172 RepID=A0AAV6U2Y0_9ARAC|nr:hypothetical protein JTE90_015687 [Oedothorax gibbosus]
MEGGRHPQAALPRVVYSLDELIRITKFTKKELQLMYRSFKQECPNGYVEEDTFRLIFSLFFPYGNVAPYAHYVFRTFDHHKAGAITFKDFVVCVSVLSRGNLREKLEWAFKLYDLNGDGRVTRKELHEIAAAIHSLVSRKCGEDTRTLTEHVDRTFAKMDINKDGVITIDEFMDSCEKDETIKESLTIFDTVL